MRGCGKGGLLLLSVQWDPGTRGHSPFPWAPHFRCKDVKRLLVSFMYLQSLLQPQSR